MQDGIVRGNNRAIIRVTPTLTAASAYASGDVLFTATEIPNAVLGNGGCSRLLSFFVLDQAKQTFDAQFYFSENNTALGTRDATANISDADLEGLNLNGVMYMDLSAAQTADLDTAQVSQVMGLHGGSESYEPMLIQAAAGSTSVYVQAIITNGTPTFPEASDLDLILHIEY